MYAFTVQSHGDDKFRLVESLQQFADEQWIPAHLDGEQAAAFVLDQFRRSMLSQIQMLEVQSR